MLKFTSIPNAPFEEAAPPPPPHLTLLALLNRMTLAERAAIRASGDPVVGDLMFLLQAAKYVDLSRQQTVDGISYLEAEGLLAEGRAAEILSAEILPEERP